jgi:membrane-associated phospholipid phosphatase
MSDGDPARAERWDERHIWRAGLAARTLWLIAFVAVTARLSMFADRWAYDHFNQPNLYDQDWARLLREMGWWPTWAVAAIALWLATRAADRVAAKRSAWLLALAPGLAGILCEVLKLLLRRERPEFGAGEYVFRAWSENPFSTAGLALPSSHTMVAFAAATALARVYPGARWVWYLLATGCAATRVISHAHFVSDVSLAALLGWCVGWGVWIAMQKAPRKSAE